jgi:hypothetical protein
MNIQAQRLTDLVMMINAGTAAGYQVGATAVATDWSQARPNFSLPFDPHSKVEVGMTADGRSSTSPWWTSDSAGVSDDASEQEDLSGSSPVSVPANDPPAESQSPDAAESPAMIEAIVDD